MLTNMQKYYSDLLRLWKLLKPFHKDFYIQLTFIVIQQLLGIFVTFIMAKIIDSLVAKDIPLVIWMLTLYPIIRIISNRLSFYTDKHSLKKIEGAIQQYLEEFSFKKIFTLNIAQYREDHSAIKLQVINRGEGAIETIVSTIVLTLLPTLLQITFVVIALSFYSIIIALFTLTVIIVTIIWTNYFTKYHRPLIKSNLEKWDNQKKIRTEAFQHLSLIKILSSEKKYLKKYLANRGELMEYHIFVWTINLVHFYRRELFLSMSRAATFVIIAILYLKSSITIGAVYALWSWINDAYNSVQSIARTLRQLPLRFTELEKYLEIIDKHALFTEGGAKEFVPGDIVFNNITFRYPSSTQEVLHDFSLSIPHNKTTAFVGHSGSGKSTIVGLLLRVYDFEKGSIQIGDTDIRNIDISSLRKHIGYVEQHVDLFDDTIKANILIGNDTIHTEDELNHLENVAQKSRIDQFYHRLGESKFDTVIGERGVKLSGGERQRIGIARAIIKNPDILIFDEATSSLDTENEKYVMEAIEDVSKGKTTIIIAHRLSTVKNADKIVVMDRGSIVGEGTHDELMEKNEVYRNLVALQL